MSIDIKTTDDTFVASTYKRFPVELVSGKGSYVFDKDGKRYIDMGSGIGVTAFGIADDEWQKAVTDQLGKIQHASNLYYTEPCAALAETLCKRTEMKKVFFSNSGAEANECAIKAAKKYASQTKGNDYFTILTLKNSFHGRTHTTLSATGQDVFHSQFQPLTPGFCYAEANNVDDFIMVANQHKLAGIIIECVQGEGGVNVLTQKFADTVYKYAQKNDVILIVDEVQTGNGRTGALYSYMNYGIKPDIVTTAKGLGGGLPIGATLLGNKVRDVFTYGDHGSTFGGNPVCCAGAKSIIDRIDHSFLEKVCEKSNFIFSELDGADGIENVTGMGLMIGIKPVASASDVIRECMGKGVLCLSAKDKVRLLPALNIPDEVLADAVKIIKDACKKCAGLA